MFLNYLISIFLTITELTNSVYLFLLNNHIFEGAIIISIIYLASRATVKEALDVTAKLVAIAAGSTVIHKNLSSSSEEDDNKDKDDKKENDENKKDENKQVTNEK